MRNKQHWQDEGGDHYQFAKTSACVLGKFEVGRVLNQFHPTEKVRQLNKDETQEKKVDRTEDNADLDSAKGEGVREQSIVDPCPVPLFVFGFRSIRICRLGWIVRRIGNVY